MAASIRVEVAYATPDSQCLLSIELAQGSDLNAAIEQSGILAKYPEIEWPGAPIGVFGKKASAQSLLKDGDRVEIYRPLRVDPKTRRRERAS